jgi:hypothetical protein
MKDVKKKDSTDYLIDITSRCPNIEELKSYWKCPECHLQVQEMKCVSNKNCIYRNYSQNEK